MSGWYDDGSEEQHQLEMAARRQKVVSITPKLPTVRTPLSEVTDAARKFIELLDSKGIGDFYAAVDGWDIRITKGAGNERA